MLLPPGNVISVSAFGYFNSFLGVFWVFFMKALTEYSVDFRRENRAPRYRSIFISQIFLSRCLMWLSKLYARIFLAIRPSLALWWNHFAQKHQFHWWPNLCRLYWSTERLPTAFHWAYDITYKLYLSITRKGRRSIFSWQLIATNRMIWLNNAAMPEESEWF